MSLATDRIEQERLSIPGTAFQFWQQQDFKEMLNKIMDKSAFYKFSHGYEKTQGIVYLLIEMLNIRGSINIPSMHPEKADKYF